MQLFEISQIITGHLLNMVLLGMEKCARRRPSSVSPPLGRIANSTISRSRSTPIHIQQLTPGKHGKVTGGDFVVGGGAVVVGGQVVSGGCVGSGRGRVVVGQFPQPSSPLSLPPPRSPLQPEQTSLPLSPPVPPPLSLPHPSQVPLSGPPDGLSEVSPPCFPLS